MASIPDLPPKQPTLPPEAPPQPPPMAKDPTAPAPPPTLNTIVDAINAPANVTSNEGDTCFLDVVPDHRFPLMSWLFGLQHDVPHNAYDPHPHASPASLIGFTYSLYIALMFHNDAHVRARPSYYAREVMNSAYVAQFFNALLDLHVPPFAELAFESLRYFRHDLASNLVAIGSEAGFSFMHDFGRFFTTGTFFGLHDLTARSPANLPLAALQLMFTKMTVARVTTQQGDTLDITPGHMFGTCFNDKAYENWLNVRLTALVNTAEIRTMASRRNAGTLPMFSMPQFPLDEINPYLFMMSLSDENLPSVDSWIRNLDTFTRVTYPSSRTLRHYTQPGTPEVLRHLIFEAPPPTWHSKSLGTEVTSSTVPDASNPFRPSESPRSHYQFAHDIHFREASHAPVPSASTEHARTVAPPTPPESGYAPPVIGAPSQEPRPLVNPYGRLIPDGTFGTVPPANIFDPVSGVDATSHHVHVIVSGILIETGDITQITLTIPNPSRNLFYQNAHYLEGGIHLDNVRATLSNTAFNVRQIKPEALDATTSGIIRGTDPTVTVPQFYPGYAVLGQNPFNLTNASEIVAGATTLLASHTAEETTNVFMSRTHSALNITSSIPLWSSFRHYDDRSKSWIWLPTLRHIAGTQARTFRTQHPSLRIPS